MNKLMSHPKLSSASKAIEASEFERKDKLLAAHLLLVEEKALKMFEFTSVGSCFDRASESFTPINIEIKRAFLRDSPAHLLIESDTDSFSLNSCYQFDIRRVETLKIYVVNGNLQRMLDLDIKDHLEPLSYKEINNADVLWVYINQTKEDYEVQLVLQITVSRTFRRELLEYKFAKSNENYSALKENWILNREIARLRSASFSSDIFNHEQEVDSAKRNSFGTDPQHKNKTNVLESFSAYHKTKEYLVPRRCRCTIF